MGTFSVPIRIVNPYDPQRSRQIELIVDTGATLTTVRREVLVEIGLRTRFSVEAVTIEGRQLRLDVGIATVELDGRRADIPVAFGLTNAPQVLGATALEILGFQVDPVSRTLIARPLLAL